MSVAALLLFAVAAVQAGLEASISVGGAVSGTLEQVVAKAGMIGDVVCDANAKSLAFAGFAATTTAEGTKTAERATIHVRVYPKTAGNFELNGLPVERGLFFEVPLEKDGAESGGVQKWKSAFTIDLLQMSGVNKPGPYTVDMFASAPTTGGDTFYYSNFGANFRFDLTLKDDAGGTCAKGPWTNVILASALDGQARFLEGYACSAQQNDVVDVELLEGRAEPFRVIATLKANKQKLGETTALGAPSKQFPFVNALCGDAPHLFVHAWNMSSFATGGLKQLALRVVGSSRVTLVNEQLFVPLCAGLGGQAACNGHGECFGPSVDGVCRCRPPFSGALCEKDMSKISTQLPLKISLHAKFRSFKPDDIDFNCCPGTDVQLNIVKAELDANKKPVYNEATQSCTSAANQCGMPSALTTHGAASFQKWFGSPVVHNATIELFLVDDTSFVYSVEMPRFFPLNGIVPATFPTVDDNTFLFTTEIEAEFVYWPGQFFSFYGDDDVWVFIDSKLALDLGGTHRAVQGAVDVDKFATFTPGSVHSLHIFHAERFCCQSSFKISTSMCFDTCPGSYCRGSEPPCEAYDTACVRHECVAGAKKRKRAVDDVAALGPAPRECYANAMVGNSCNADDKACTRDTCDAAGKCNVGPDSCTTLAGQTTLDTTTPTPTVTTDTTSSTTRFTTRPLVATTTTMAPTPPPTPLPTPVLLPMDRRNVTTLPPATLGSPTTTSTAAVPTSAATLALSLHVVATAVVVTAIGATGRN